MDKPKKKRISFDIPGYDSDGLLTASGSFTISRNQETGLSETVFNNAVTMNRTFNSYGELESSAVLISSSPVLAIDLARNDNGRITEKIEAIRPTPGPWLINAMTIGNSEFLHALALGSM